MGSAEPGRAQRAARMSSALDVEEFFAPQRTSLDALPDPEPLIRNLAIGVMEDIAGVRDADQMARWLGEDAFAALVVRANLSTRARSARGLAVARPQCQVLSVRTASPAEGVVEVVVVISTRVRCRAIAMRLEGWDRRWRATDLRVM